MTSRVQRSAAKVVLVATALTLGACSQYGVANRSISVNKGLETANNRMLLLNAVRASKRYPMAFSAINFVSTSDPLSGSVGLSVPFGGDAASRFIVTPNISLDSGITMQITPMDKQEFTRGITTPTSLETLNYYLRQGWPEEMLFLMFVRTMRIKNPCAETFLDQPKATALENLKKCPDDKDDKQVTPETELLENAPGKTEASQTKFNDFQTKLRDLIKTHKLQVRELETVTPSAKDWTTTTRITKRVPERPGGEKKLKIVKQITTEEPSEATKSSRLILAAKLPKAQFRGAMDLVSMLPKVRKKQKEKLGCIEDKDEPKSCYVEVEVAPLRSPEAMIFYMGELIDTQVNSSPQYIPMIKKSKDSDALVPLLRVTKGRPKGASAVKVSHEGETYAIPRAAAGRSMSVMSLVSLIFGLHRNALELPTTPTVTLTGQ